MGPVKPSAGLDPGIRAQKPVIPGIPGAREPQDPSAGPVSFGPAVSRNPVSLLFSRLSDSPPEVFKQTAAVLGLPKDALTFTLIAFSRLFSLPVDAGILGGLRQETLAAGASSPKTGGEKAKTGARALAAAAAAARGLRLSPEALDEYAAALSAEGRGSGEDEGGAFTCCNAEELRRLFEKFMGEDGLLPSLNRIPAGDGRYWAVWPFKISIGGVDLQVFIRILKREGTNSPVVEGSAAMVPDRLIADVSGPGRRWRFIVDKFTGGKAVSGETDGERFKAEISVYPWPPPFELETLRREGEEAFAGLGAEITVRNGGKDFSPEIFFPAEFLPSVDGEA